MTRICPFSRSQVPDGELKQKFGFPLLLALSFGWFPNQIRSTSYERHEPPEVATLCCWQFHKQLTTSNWI